MRFEDDLAMHTVVTFQGLLRAIPRMTLCCPDGPDRRSSEAA